MADADKLTPGRIFLALALTFGCLFAFLTPPFQAPDEYDHFHRAYQVSEGHLLGSRLDDQAGGFQPRSLIEFQDQVSQGIPHHPEIKQDITTLLAMRKIALRPDDREFILFPWYSPTNYFPQAAGIAIARNLGAGPLMLVYAGRLGNLLAWSLLIWLALRLMPMMKWTLFLLALMPMSLWLASSLSADAMVNAICFLFAATILHFAIADDRPMNRRRLVTLFFLCVAVALAKTAYLPITLLLLIIPSSKFGGRRNYWLAFAFFLGVGLTVNFGWALCTYKDFVIPGNSPSAQASYMLHHPLTTLLGFVGQFFSIPLLCSIVGKLGWYDTRLWRPAIVCYVAILVWTALLGGSPRFRLRARQKLIAAFAAVGMWLALFALVDLAFTKVGAQGATSIQGRYFVPMVPLVFLLLCPSQAARRPPRALLIGGFSACFSIYVAFTLWLRFYG